MSQTSGFWGSFRSVAVIFVVGTSLGFVWRQGWVPVEVSPAKTGTLDPAEEQNADDPPVQLIAPSMEPIVHQDVLPNPTQKAFDSHALTELDQAIFTQQQEPEPANKSPAMTPPQRLPATDVSQMPQPYRRTGSTDIQGAAYSESVDAFPEDVPAEFVSTAEPQSLSGDESSDAADPAQVPLAELLNQYDQKIQSGEVLAAHRILSEAYWKRRADRMALVERLDRSAATIFFQPQPHFVEPYLIEPGDRLERIAEHYHVTWEYLSKLNRVDPKRIQAGRRLKVVRGPFSAVVELEDYSITIHLQGYYVRRFPVGIGRDRSSPIGRFAVLNKVVNPQYTDPDGHVIAGDDPANPLGERWIDLGNSYGIHGTIEPDSIGRAASRGCIRLNDKDIVNVYDFLSVGSEVVIRP